LSLAKLIFLTKIYKNTMSDELKVVFLEAVQKLVAEVSNKRLVFFVAGRTGWGKSSTVNSLLDRELCPVNDDEPQTAEVTGHDFEMNGVKGTIFDTPGLCDGSGNEQEYIKMIRSKVRNPHAMLYVSRLDETRPENDRQVIKIISEALGNSLWENTVIVFTFANHVKASDYKRKLDQRKKQIQELIKEELIKDHIYDANIAYNIPSVAIDNHSKTTPDGKEWLGFFFTAIVERVSKEGTIALLAMLTDSMSQRTIFDTDQKSIIRKKFAEAVIQSSGTAIAIGVTVTTIVNAPLILGFSGGGIVGTLIGCWLSEKKD
jgi:predicted GTPase